MAKALKNLMLWTVLFGGLWISAVPAQAQLVQPFESAATRNARYAPAESRPTVSPYLNLGVTPSGLSNYQSLVRPLIEERDSLNRQRAELEQLNRQVRHGRVAEPGRLGNGARLGSSVRFLHYSHYFNAGR